jgi:methanogenic corrinoid protein MtbC1
MTFADLFKQYLEHLFRGQRSQARRVILDAQDRGTDAQKLLTGIVWPAMEQIDNLYRTNQISRVVEHMATRINRQVADQLQPLLPDVPKTGKRMALACGEGETAELGAQIMADVFESRGWTVWFLGANVPNDEVLQFVGQIEPDILCVYGMHPQGAPGVRKLIDSIRDIGVVPEMQVLLSGGVFNRAEGLAEEINADLFAPDPIAAMDVVADHPVKEEKPDVPTPGRRRKSKKTDTAAVTKARKEIAAGKDVKTDVKKAVARATTKAKSRLAS